MQYSLEKSSVTEYSIPEDVVKVEKQSFESARFLKKITFGSKVTEIGEFAFRFKTSLKSFAVNGNAKYESIDGVFF